jgi:MFS family permease
MTTQAPLASSGEAADHASASLAVQVPRYSYYALAILSLANFLNYIDRQVLPAVAPLMFKDPRLNLTDSELGYMEAALLYSFTVLAPLFGRLGDRRSRTRLMAGAAVIWSLATGLTGVIDHAPFLPGSIQLRVPLVQWTIIISGAALAMCVVRAIVGVGESAYSTITPTLIADYFPPQRRATALGVFQAAIPMGFALGFVIGGLLAKYFGWRAAFMIVGVPGIITAMLVWRLREPVRGGTDQDHNLESGAQRQGTRDQDRAVQAHEQEAGPHTTHAASRASAPDGFWRAVWSILRVRDWLLSTAGYTALTFTLGAFATWATTLLERDKGMSAANAAVTLGIVTLLGGAAGTFGGGWVADRVAARRRNAYFLVCATSTLIGIGPTLVALIADDARLYLPAVFFAVMLLFVSNAPFHAILISSVPASVRATAVALNIVIIHSFGDALSRPAVGIISDALKSGRLGALTALAATLGIEPDQHLTAALLIAPFALLTSTLLFFWGAKGAKNRATP